MKILIVEDSPADAALIARELEKHFGVVESTRVETPEEFAAAITDRDWDVIIADHQLPRFSSTVALASLQGSRRDIPLIVVSGKMGEDFAVAAMRAGARDYVLKSHLARLGPAVAREVRDAESRKRAEAALRANQERMRTILETANEGIWVADAEGRIEFANARAAEMFGISSVGQMLGRKFFEVLPDDLRHLGEAERPSFARGESAKRELKVPRADGSVVWLIMSRSALHGADGNMTGAVAFFMDVTDQHRAQVELLQAQKMEAVGRLASGIAHEINTPVQFIGDNTRFQEEAFTALARFVQGCRSAAAAGPIQSITDLERDAVALELDYFIEEVPKTIARTLEGVARIATIVRAMKEFAHPDQAEMVSVDLNRAIRATLEIARNEYKYVADVETHLGDIPPVTCCAGDVNQIFLNILINAAHAIEDVVKGTQRRGTIHITTRLDGPAVVVGISDTGTGIPEGIHDKVFEPFFTTKDVGRGSGQGLAIARNIVAKHKGRLTFTTKFGEGTTFLIRLPVDPAAVQERA